MQLQVTAVGNYSLPLHVEHLPVEFTEAVTPQSAWLVVVQLVQNLKQPSCQHICEGIPLAMVQVIL